MCISPLSAVLCRPSEKLLLVFAPTAPLIVLGRKYRLTFFFFAPAGVLFTTYEQVKKEHFSYLLLISVTVEHYIGALCELLTLQELLVFLYGVRV